MTKRIRLIRNANRFHYLSGLLLTACKRCNALLNDLHVAVDSLHVAFESTLHLIEQLFVLLQRIGENALLRFDRLHDTVERLAFIVQALQRIQASDNLWKLIVNDIPTFNQRVQLRCLRCNEYALPHVCMCARLPWRDQLAAQESAQD
jgi:hypothetical protein